MVFIPTCIASLDVRHSIISLILSQIFLKHFGDIGFKISKLDLKEYLTQDIKIKGKIYMSHLWNCSVYTRCWWALVDWTEMRKDEICMLTIRDLTLSKSRDLQQGFRNVQLSSGLQEAVDWGMIYRVFAVEKNVKCWYMVYCRYTEGDSFSCWVNLQLITKYKLD